MTLSSLLWSTEGRINRAKFWFGAALANTMALGIVFFSIHLNQLLLDVLRQSDLELPFPLATADRLGLRAFAAAAQHWNWAALALAGIGLIASTISNATLL